MDAAGRWLRAAARLRREERGLTVVEGVVACLLLTVGSLAVLQVFDAATRNTYRAEGEQVVVNRLQNELETVRRIPYSEIAMTAAPQGSTDRNDPRWRVNGTAYALSRQGTDSAPMVINGGPLDGGGQIAGGAVEPGPEPFQSGDVSGQVFRFVTWRNDPGCPEALCPGQQDMKRIVIAATVEEGTASIERSFHEIHADAADPDATPVENPAPVEGEEQGTTAEFWLTDTSCDHSDRQPITSDHPTHNTRGTCADGMTTAGTRGAPDLMLTRAPALDPNHPPDGQPLYDYATDVEPAQDADLDKGLLLRRSSQPGCLLSGGLLDMPLLEPGKHEKVHKWLSEPIPDDFELLLRGEATLELWTQTLNGAAHPGKICVWLFTRKLNLLGEPVDVPIANIDDPQQAVYFQYSSASWPRDGLTELAVPMHFLSTQLLPGERLGLAITVERAGTAPGEALQLMYDHPSFDSRLQVKTDGALPL